MTNVEYNKQYYLKNKEKIRQVSKLWKQQNKDIINERRRNEVSVQCECGGQFKKYHIHDHFKSKRHQRFINKKHIEITTNELTISFY